MSYFRFAFFFILCKYTYACLHVFVWIIAAIRMI